MEFNRLLDLKAEISQKSIFLFGPRQTGKTYLLKHLFPDAPFYNLLLADVFLKLSLRPSLIRETLAANPPPFSQPIIIDEVQKLPILLDEVQHLIEEKKYRFILTGSSARKLKRSGANLLAGRARTKYLFPAVTPEIPDYSLLRILSFGALPFVYNSQDPAAELADYVGTYLQEEIQAESLVRNITHFSSFLQTAALSNCEQLNFSKIASDAGVPQRTTVEYYKILEDTRIGYLLLPFTQSRNRKIVSQGKFYFFDVGVSNFLCGRATLIQPKTELFGKTLEQFILTELKAYVSYKNDGRNISFWRTRAGVEVDFLLGDEVAIEVKGTDFVTEKHLKGLSLLAEEVQLKRQIIVSMDPTVRKIGNILILPVELFLKQLWNSEF